MAHAAVLGLAFVVCYSSVVLACKTFVLVLISFVWILMLLWSSLRVGAVYSQHHLAWP
jgi:hypothetical protein